MILNDRCTPNVVGSGVLYYTQFHYVLMGIYY